MGVIMVLGIIGLGLAAPVIYPAVFIYAAFENVIYSIGEIFKKIGFGN